MAVRIACQQAAVDGEEAGCDQRHPGELARVEPLAEDEGAQEERDRGHQERDEQQVGRAGGGEDAEVDEIGERGADEREAGDRRPRAQTGHRQRPRPVQEEGRGKHEDRRGGDLGGGRHHRRRAGEAPAEDPREGVGHGGGEDGELGDDVGGRVRRAHPARS